MLFEWAGVVVCRCEVKTVGLIPLSTPEGCVGGALSLLIWD